MSKIHNEYSPINPVGLVQETEQNDRLINGILPARRTINIRGLWESATPIPIISRDMAITNITASGWKWQAVISPYKTAYPDGFFKDSNNFPGGYYHLHIDNVTLGNNPNATNDPRKGLPRIGFCASQSWSALRKVENNYINTLAKTYEYDSIESLNDNRALFFNEVNISNIYGVYPERGSSENPSQYDEIIYIDGTWSSLLLLSNYTAGNVSSGKITYFSGITLDYIPWLNYDSKQIYWTPSPSQNNIVKVKIPQPAPAINSTWLPVRPLASPSNPDAVVDTASNISLKGFATKETVERWVESSDFADYYEMLTSNWWLSTKEVAEDNGEFSFNRYLDTEDFPYDVLFECDVDIPVKTANGQRYIEFDSGVGLDEQDIFAIYERKKFDYKFYYAGENGNLYATKSVHYGDPVGNPTQEDAGNNQLPTSIGTTYRLTSSTSGGVTTWTATQAAQTQGDGYTYASTKTEISTLSPWKIRGTNTITNMSNVYASDTGNHNYEMNMVTTIPVVCVIDGEIETKVSGYGSDGNSNYDCVGNFDLYDYDSEPNGDFRGIESGSSFPCDFSGFYIYKHDTEIPARDTSFIRNCGGWFTNADCTNGYISGSATLTGSAPIILYQKTTKMCGVKFNIDDDSRYSFTIGATLKGGSDCVGVSYSYSSTSYTLEDVLWDDNSNTLYIAQSTTLKIRPTNLNYRYVDYGSNTIGDAKEWTDSTNSSIKITKPTSDYNSFVVNGDYNMDYTMTNVDKPKIIINSATGFAIKSKTSGVTPANTTITATAQDFTYNNLSYRARISDTNTYEIICLSANASSIDTASNYSLAWIDVVDNSATEDFGGFTVNSSNFNINTGTISLKSGQSTTLAMFTTKQLTVSVNNLNFFRKNNSPSNAVHSDTNYTINVYMDESPNQISRTYTPSGSIQNINANGARITNIEVLDNNTSNLAYFRGLSTDVAGNNMITLPYTLTGNTTLYVQWRLPTYKYRLIYNNNPANVLIDSTEYTYNPISLDNENTSLDTNYNVYNNPPMKVRVYENSGVSNDYDRFSGFVGRASGTYGGIICIVGEHSTGVLIKDYNYLDNVLSYSEIRKLGTMDENGVCTTGIWFVVYLKYDTIYRAIKNSGEFGNYAQRNNLYYGASSSGTQIVSGDTSSTLELKKNLTENGVDYIVFKWTS